MLIQYHWNSKFVLRGGVVATNVAMSDQGLLIKACIVSEVAKNVAMSDQGLLIKACIVSDNPPEKKLGTLRSGWQSATRGVVTLHMNGQTQRTSMQGASKRGVPLIASSLCVNH